MGRFHVKYIENVRQKARMMCSNLSFDGEKKGTNKKSIYFVMLFCYELFAVFLYARKEVELLFSECRLFVDVGNGVQSEFTIFSTKKTW